ncbi:hypothetical protein CBR_g21916 [Chara braunii]|uniref:Uncharacterized protein n=1 Tax=Chara braunii TaxID=69332 RepID=A0A388L1J0_CHABU|nr:hypothetical protein CBR_g21916 [Chara braunii]|eukprot:GBG76167.1 hypothetical protein CBR_g21916 [Chara braunii]
MLEIYDTLSKLLGTMVSVSFQTMLQASPRLLKGLRQLLTRQRVEIDENPESPEGEGEEEASQEVANLQRSRGDLEDLEKAFAEIRLSLPDREGGEVMRAPPVTKLRFHALPVGKLKIQIATHHTDALVDGVAEITLLRRDFTTITGCTGRKKDLRKAKMEFGNENDSGAINRPTGGEEAGPSRRRRTTKRKLYIGLISGQVVGRGARKHMCRGPSPLRKGEGIYISSGSESEEERASVGEGGKADVGNKAQASDGEGAERCEQCESCHGESEGRQDVCDRREDREERGEGPHEEWSGHDSCEGRYPSFEEGYGGRAGIPYSYDPKNLTDGYSPIQTKEEEEVQEVIEISSGDEKDEISRPREERRPPIHQPREGAFRWEDEFGPTPKHWFQQWLSGIKHKWIIKARELAKAGMVATPLDFYSELFVWDLSRDDPQRGVSRISHKGVRKSVEGVVICYPCKGQKEVGEWGVADCYVSKKNGAKDASRGLRAFDKLQTIHSCQWKSVRALTRVMDELVAVPGHGVTEIQLVQLFYSAMPEPLRGHFFERSKESTMTYDTLSREVVTFKAQSMPTSTFWHKDLDKGQNWKGCTISGRVRAKDHLILTLDEGGMEKVPYSQIEWGLEEEDNGSGQGRTYAAVAAGGRPQGRGRGQGQGGRASGGRGRGAQGVGGKGNRQDGDDTAAAAKKKAEDAEQARRLALEQQRQHDEAATRATNEERNQRREKIFSGEQTLLTMAAEWRTEGENGKLEDSANKIALLLSHLTDLLATCITQQEDIHSLDDSLAQVQGRLQQLEQRPVAAPDASSSNTSDRLAALEMDIGSLKDDVQLQQTATQQLEQRICTTANTSSSEPRETAPKFDGQEIFCDSMKTDPVPWFHPVEDRVDDRRLTRSRALRVPHVYQALQPGDERRLQAERRACALASTRATANAAAREQAAAAARAAAMTSSAASSAALSGTYGTHLGMPLSSTSSTGTSGSTGSQQSTSQMAGSQFSPLTPRERELREIQQVERLRQQLEEDLKKATDRERDIKSRAARLDTLEADKAALEGLDETGLSNPLKVLKNNMLSLHAHVDSRLDFMQSTLDPILDALTRPGFRSPAQSPLPLSAMSGPFPVQAGTQPSGTSAAVSQTVASSSSGPAVGATPSQQQASPQPGQPQGQWYRKTLMKPPLAFSGEGKGEELNTWLRTVPVWVKAKRTLLEDEVVTAASYLEGDKKDEALDTWLTTVPMWVRAKRTLVEEEVITASSYLEGSAARWLNGLVASKGFDRNMGDWAQTHTLESFMDLVEAWWHNPQQAQIATDGLLKLDARKYKSLRELTTTVKRLIVVPGVEYNPQVLLTTFLRYLPTDIKNLLASEACREYHTFETFSKKALDLEAMLGSAQTPSTNGRKKKTPQEWKK